MKSPYGIAASHLEHPAHFRHAARLGVLLASLLASACQGDPPPSPRDWQVAEIHCPLGCNAELRAFLRGQIAQAVTISTEPLQAPWLDACEGRVRWVQQRRAVAQLLQELNQGVGGKARFKAEDLGLADGAQVVSAIAYCRSASSELTMARAPVWEAQRVLLLFEQQSLIELRPAARFKPAG